MKSFVHARIGKDERAALEALKRTTGQSESEIVRRGLKLVVAEHRQEPSALHVAGKSAGRFKGAPKDLSSHPSHLDGFGE